jgi:hypothetical protein
MAMTSMIALCQTLPIVSAAKSQIRFMPLQRMAALALPAIFARTEAENKICGNLAIESLRGRAEDSEIGMKPIDNENLIGAFP